MRGNHLAYAATQGINVERMDGYRMAGRVLMAEVRGGRVRGAEVRLDGWCEGGLGQHRNDDERKDAAMRGKYERVESPGAHVTE